MHVSTCGAFLSLAVNSAAAKKHEAGRQISFQLGSQCKKKDKDFLITSPALFITLKPL